MTLHDASRKRLFALFAALIALATTLTWAANWLTARNQDNSHELLRQAGESDTAPRPWLVTGKTTQVEGRTSSGEAIRVNLTAVKSATGKEVGSALRLQQPLKEGETASLKLPGGGQIVIQGPPPGVSLPSSLTPTPGRSQP
jgi:hypothetical protein